MRAFVLVAGVAMTVVAKVFAQAAPPQLTMTVSSYMIVDRAGNVVGTVAPLANTRPLAISATHMWGVELDQNDVPSVVRYRVGAR